MALETATYVGGLNSGNPTATDPKSQGDDHLRLLKTSLLNTFAGFAGMVIVTGAEAQGATASDYTVTVSPAPTAYTASMLVVFKATHANIGASTVQIGALGTKSLLAVDGSVLKAGDIESGGLVAAFYDGTNFLLLSGNDRSDRNGDTYTGVHDLTGATVSIAAPIVSNNPVTKAYADNLSFAVVLPAQSGNAGKLITTNGTTASWGVIGTALQLLRVNSGGTAIEGYTLNVNPQWQIKTTNYTAVSGDSIQANTTGGVFTVTLPASPAANDLVRIADYAGTFATNNLTVGSNGLKIMGLAEDMVISTNNVSITLQYIDATQGWRIV